MFEYGIMYNDLVGRSGSANLYNMGECPYKGLY
jgi:hypothetical protein